MSYMNTLRVAASAAALAGAVVPQAAPAEVLDKETMDAILATWGKKDVPAEFPAFVEAVSAEHPDLQPAAGNYLGGEALDGDGLIDIGRLLGIHSVLVNGEASVETLGTLVEIPTFRDSDIPPYENPAIREIGEVIEGITSEFGLPFRNVDNRIFEVKLPGSGDKEFGILTHADVVPADAAEWVLDGEQIDPYALTVRDGVMYGRGTIDDKGPITAALYAMRAVRESGIPLTRGIRLMIETTEETGGEGMDYYRESNELPEYNIVLDSRYPAVVAEKGAGYVRAYFPEGESATGGNTIIGMTGAPAPNAVPSQAGATIHSDDPIALADRLRAAKDHYITANAAGGDFDIEITGDQEASEIFVTVKGASAHGSRPEEGVNPVPRLTGFLLENADLSDNGWRRAGEYINEVYGTDYLGEKLGVGYSDDFMGPLTVTPTYFNEAEGRIEVAANIRIPRGRTADEVKAMVADKLAAFDAEKGWSAEYAHSQGDWMARDPSGAWLATLLDIFGDTTGLPAKPIPTAGSTTAKQMPNAINFGPSMPGFKYTAHGALENHLTEHMHNDIRMFTEMLLRIGNLPQMQ